MKGYSDNKSMNKEKNGGEAVIRIRVLGVTGPARNMPSPSKLGQEGAFTGNREGRPWQG